MLQNQIKVATLREVLASRARATFSHRINFQTVNIDNLNLMNTWCENNCKGLWRNERVHAIYWQFEDSNDATMFMLRWANADGNQLK